MKREQAIVLLSGAITVAALTFAAGIYRSGTTVDPFRLDRLQDPSYLTQALHLDPPQVQQIMLLTDGLRDQLQNSCQRNCQARQELVSALADGTNGSARTDAILTEMCRAYEQSEQATLDHIRQVRAVLDEPQRERFDEMLAECLCRSCPTCRAARDHVKPAGQEHGRATTNNRKEPK